MDKLKELLDQLSIEAKEELLKFIRFCEEDNERNR
jgi:hypothetical protein